MQDKASLGTRYTCYECGKKFYDLNREEPICPGCGADQREDPTPDPRVAVMARYKGTRLTTDQTMPSKEQFKVDDDATEEGGDQEGGAEGAAPAADAEGAEDADASEAAAADAPAEEAAAEEPAKPKKAKKATKAKKAKKS